MTNIAIVIDKEKWIPYNFNASHPIYLIDENLEKYIKALYQKSQPDKASKLSEFKILKEKFDPFDKSTNT